jgi:hypothetical protein
VHITSGAADSKQMRNRAGRNHANSRQDVTESTEDLILANPIGDKAKVMVA